MCLAAVCSSQNALPSHTAEILLLQRAVTKIGVIRLLSCSERTRLGVCLALPATLTMSMSTCWRHQPGSSNLTKALCNSAKALQSCGISGMVQSSHQAGLYQHIQPKTLPRLQFGQCMHVLRRCLLPNRASWQVHACMRSRIPFISPVRVTVLVLSCASCSFRCLSLMPPSSPCTYHHQWANPPISQPSWGHAMKLSRVLASW